MLGSARAEALSYSAVKLFSTYSNLCENHTTTDRQTDGQTTYCGITALCVASRDKKYGYSTIMSRPQADISVVRSMCFVAEASNIPRI